MLSDTEPLIFEQTVCARKDKRSAVTGRVTEGWSGDISRAGFHHRVDAVESKCDETQARPERSLWYQTTGRDSPRRGTRAHPKYLPKWSGRDRALTALAGRITSTRWREASARFNRRAKARNEEESIIGEGFSIFARPAACLRNADQEIELNRQHLHLRNYEFRVWRKYF